MIKKFKLLPVIMISFAFFIIGCGRPKGTSSPVISSFKVSPNPVTPGGIMTAVVVASDPDGDVLHYSWTASQGWTVTGYGVTATIAAPSTYGTGGYVTVTADDGSGDRVSGSLPIITEGNNSTHSIPVINSITASPNPVNKGGVMAISVSVTDLYSNTLAYTWTAPAGWTISSGQGTAQISVKAPNSYGNNGIVYVTMNDGNGGIVTGSIGISTQVNTPPAISSISASPNPVTPGEPITVVVSASDPDGDTPSYSWTTTTGWAITGYGTTATVVSPFSYSTGGYVTVTVDDNYGGVVTGTIAISTERNGIPAINSITASPNPVGIGQTVTVIVNASDPDGDTLSYSWTTTTGWSLTGSGPTVTIIAPFSHSTGGYVTVTVDDGAGGTVTGSVALSTTPEWPPFITSISISPQPVITYANLLCDASDPDGDFLSYVWSIGGVNVTTGSQATWASPGIPGNYNANVTVSDGFNNSVTGTSTVIVGSSSPWPRFHRDIQSTGSSPYNTSSTTGALKWSYTTGDYIYSSPAIGGDGTIYIGSDDGKLYSINPNGGLNWSYPTGGAIWYSSPAIGNNGTIYIGSSDGQLYAISSSGSLDWSYPTGGPIWYSSPAIGADGTIYIGSGDSNLYAINNGGGLNWTYTTGSEIYSSPAIGVNGTIYVGSGDGNLYAINPDGTRRWNYSTGSSIYSSPAIGVDGTIYVQSSSGSLYAINPNGGLDWSYTTGSAIDYSSPAIGANGTIYVGSGVSLYAIYSTGSLDWTYPTLGNINSSPAVGSDGTIYVGSSDGNLYAINQNGTLKWFYADRLSALGMDSSPAIGADGTIYAGSVDFNLYAIH
ncbi:MAG: PQQ-binding-like beta-propeller repeat protein [Deltaproteobacteria bacterium]|nr:PQQ-binding-like beta-propeller repeat protein [Deltaproteobacteria bacterium]MCL5792863.1 PQQ-binding-like beta-propeller repeat protein [Deltaproteobacteria bacterium]